MILPSWLNPWVLLATVLLIASAGAEGYHFGSKTATQAAAAADALIVQTAAAGQAAMQKTAADAISNIQIKNTTIQEKAVETIREIPVYQDCKNTDSVKQLILDSRVAP